MKFKRRLSAEVGFSQIDFVPFINVAFLLIIFFLLISKSGIAPGASVTLPKLLAPDALDAHVMLITISDNNQIFVKGSLVSIEDLEREIIRNKSVSIFIQADKHSSLDVVGLIYQICKKLGIERIGLATTFQK